MNGRAMSAAETDLPVAVTPPSATADAVPRSARSRRNRPPQRRRKLSRTALFSGRVLVAVAVLGIWELVAKLKLVDPLLASSPKQVWDYLMKSAENGELWRNLSTTLEAALIALVLAAVVGIVVGLGLALLPNVESLLSPYLTGLNSMPRIALAPVFIIYFGINTEAKVALAFSVVVFIVLVNTRAGVKNADRDVLQMAFVMGTSRLQMFWKILLPVAVPGIFAGIRLGVTYSLLGVVTSEIIAAKSGLGVLVQTYSANFDLSAVYGILIVLAVVAGVLDLLMGIAERYLLRWQVAPVSD